MCPASSLLPTAAANILGTRLPLPQSSRAGGVHIKAPGLDWLTSLDLDDLGSVGRHLVELTAGTL
jgi:hypothetical protein